MQFREEAFQAKSGTKKALGRRYNRIFLLLTQLIVSAVAIYLSVRKVDFDDFLSIVRGINLISLGWIILSIIAIIASFLVRSLLWGKLLNSANSIRVGYFQSFRVLMIGFFANNILPAKAGEFVRSYLIKKKTSLQQSYVLGTIFLERIFDVLNLFLFLFIGISIFKSPTWLEQYRIVGLALLSLIFLLMVFLLKWKGRDLSKSIIRFGPFIEGKFNFIIASLNTFRIPIHRLFNNKTELSIILLLSFITWTFAAISLFCSGKALNIQINFLHYFLILGVINLGSLVPAAPGAVGVYQYLTVLVLPLYGINHNLSFTFGVLSHIIFYLVSSFIGLFFLIYENISIFRIYSLHKAAEQSPRVSS